MIRTNTLKKVYGRSLCGAALLMLLYSCGSFRLPEESRFGKPEYPAPAPEVSGKVSVVIAAPGVKTPQQLYRFFMDNRPDANQAKVMRLATYYTEEAKKEGINSDVAFVQMCLETGFLRFGGLVTEQMNNFCGLGAIDETQRGVSLPTEQLGVRAHIQHLHAYGTTVPLKDTPVDPRYKYVSPRGKAPTVASLSGTWAADRNYGSKLEALLQKLEAY